METQANYNCGDYQGYWENKKESQTVADWMEKGEILCPDSRKIY